MTRHRTRIGLLITGLAAATPSYAATLTMGAGQAYTTLSSAVAAASAGDTIDVLAGTYTDQTANITKALTIQGVGGTAIFTQTAGTELGNLKAFLVIDANATISNLSFQNAAISDANGGNGAGIRFQSGNLVVTNSAFVGNQDGILATPSTAGTGTVTVSNSIFSNNGQGSGPRAGFEHALYATYLSVLTVTDSSFNGTLVGNDIKSRAVTSIITNNYLDDGMTGTASYAADFSNGGNVTFTGNTVVQGPDTQNSTMLAYDTEGLIYGSNRLTVTGNTFTNTNGSSIAVNNFSSSVVASVTGNAFDGVQTSVQGPAILSGNVTNAPLPATSVPEPPAYSLVLVSLLMLGALRLKSPRAEAG